MNYYDVDWLIAMNKINLIELIDKKAADKNKIAIYFYDEMISYGELLKKSRSVSSYLIKKGLKKGDVVAIDMMNRPEVLQIIFGTWLAGAVVTPINTQLKEREILYQIEDSNSKIIFYEDKFEERVENALKNGKNILSIKFTGNGNYLEKDNLYSEVFNNFADTELPEQSEDLFIIYTSGTTGSPKGAVLTSWNVFTEAIQLRQVVGIEETDRTMIILPLFHVNNLMFSIVTMMGNGSIIILRWFDIAEFFTNIKKYGGTIFSGVPTIYKLLIDSYSHFNIKDLETVKVAICGAAPMPEMWIKDFERIYNIPVIEGYGLTEGTVASTINPRFGKRKVGSIGIPFPGQTVAIFDEHNNELSVNEIGEIAIRGPNIMKGYLNKERETNETLKNGWLHTGDLGYMDHDGYFYIVDRKKDMIIRGGENIYPKEIENLLSGMPGIKEVAVVGKKDEKYGEEVVAFAVKSDESLSEQQIIDYCKENIAWFKCPKKIYFIDELPKNAVGKIQKFQLKKLL